jgi:omega-6 fatty acid desaturase (delta-12 desaturase)
MGPYVFFRLGVPYHSWRITHAKHHASTGHMLQDQVFVPKTRSQLGLPAFNPAGEELSGSQVKQEVARELQEALQDSPIYAAVHSMGYLLLGWPLYITKNASGQVRYPKGTNHFRTDAPMFAPHQWADIIWSDIGIAIWIGAIWYASQTFGFLTVFKTYLVPYVW